MKPVRASGRSLPGPVALGGLLATMLIAGCASGGDPGGGAGTGGSGGRGGAPATPPGTGGASTSGSGGAPGTGGSASGSGGTAGGAGGAGASDAAADGSGPPPAAVDGGGDPGPAPSVDGLAQRLATRGIGLAYYHLCVIQPSRGLRCSGDLANAGDPRIHPPSGLMGEQIMAAHNGFCVLRPAAATQDAFAVPPEYLAVSVTGKRLTCWGHKNTFFPPANLEMDPVQYGIGYDHGCALNRDGSVVCWGQAGTNFKAPDGLQAKQLTVAAFFNCAIKMDDTVVCWGINPPTPPPGLKVKLLAATFHGNAKLPEAPQGTAHACAIKLDDTVTCWGTEVEGNLTPPADLVAAKDIAVSTWDSCALRPSGEPVCWGRKVYDNFDAVRYHKLPPGLRLKGLRASMATYCGIKMEDDTVVCWGDEQHDHITFPAAGVKVYAP